MGSVERLLSGRGAGDSCPGGCIYMILCEKLSSGIRFERLTIAMLGPVTSGMLLSSPNRRSPTCFSQFPEGINSPSYEARNQLGGIPRMRVTCELKEVTLWFQRPKFRKVSPSFKRG